MKKLYLLMAFLLFLSSFSYAQEIVVKNGDTLYTILNNVFKPAQIINIAKDIKEKIPNFSLREGYKVLFNDNSVKLTLDITKEIEILKSNDSYNIKVIEHPVSTITSVVSGEISSSLFETMASIGENDDLAIMLANIFEYEVDFFKDIREGDSFKIVVEKRFCKGSFIGYGKILAADFVNKGKVTRAYYYDDGKSAGYFTSDGKYMKKGFLKAPLKFGRVSSKFTAHRKHPVLNKVLPHFGVDYAAPTGTPVHATADGTVVQKTFQKGAGNYVKLKHFNNYETTYMHFSKFKQGLKVGQRVVQGEVIGYVGSTGYATGPHVDYRIQQGKTYVNPLSFTAPAVAALSKAKISAMHINSDKYARLLDSSYIKVASYQLIR